MNALAPLAPTIEPIGRQIAATGPAPLRPLITARLAETNERRGTSMPRVLRDRYGAELVVPLRPDRPTVVANFVSTLDGVVAFDTAEASGGGEVSGFAEPDRFVMGLLRALADVVVVGAGTVRAAPDHVWTAQHAHRASAAGFARWREDLGLRPHPTTIVVSASGRLPGRHPGLTDPSVPAVIITTPAGADRVGASSLASHVSVRTGSAPDVVTPDDVLEVAAGLGARLVLCEGGPHVLGQLLEAGLVDELFLTIAPVITGEVEAIRIVEGEGIGGAVRARPVWVLRAQGELFLRYAL